MKTNFFVLLFCSWFLFIGNTFGQTDFVLKFRIWKNGTTYLGEYTFNAGPSSNYGLSLPPGISTQLCPGDELKLQNLCSYNGAQHSFNGNGMGPGATNPFGRCTVGLTSKVACSVVGPPANPNYIQHLGDVTNGPFYSSSLPTYQNWSSWNWGAYKTVTLPNYISSTGNTYLTISAQMFTNKVTHCGCGGRYYFIGLNMGSINHNIADQDICPGDVVNLGLNPSYTYSNWNPSNPDGTSPTNSQSYTVDISNASGCTISNTFDINVQNPDADLLSIDHLCYNQSTQITEDDFWNLYVGNTSPKEIYINGTLVADDATIGTDNLPQVIDGPTYGAGVVTVEYVYYTNTGTCSKTYEITIHPQIELDIQSAYAFCSGNFQPICATASGVAQPGITYKWTKSGVPFVLGMGVCFTPSSYGTYFVTAEDEFGCEERRSFRVYDPGVGIKHPANITFCSMTQRPPSFVGWFSDPFGPIRYSFNWTYTDVNGSTTSIVNTGAQYQVPYLGPGTYTAVVNANGCTETISITVTDLLQIYNNHSNASFTFTPLFGNQVSCQPTLSMFGVNDIWTVEDEFGNTVATSSYLNGIKFSYTTGVSYSVTLRREAPRSCQIFINEFTWLDNARRRRESISNNSTDLAPATVNVFPNPTTGLLNINLKDVESNQTTVQVFNALGQVVLQKEATDENNLTIDLSQKTSGVYTIQIVNGAQQFTEKIIKE